MRGWHRAGDLCLDHGLCLYLRFHPCHCFHAKLISRVESSVSLSLQVIMTPAAVSAVHQAQRETQRAKAVGFLRKTFAASTAHVDDQALDKMVHLIIE